MSLFAWALPSPGEARLPPGGTVRSLAADPVHAGTVLLGTTTGILFRSTDAGAHWSFYSRIAGHADWVVSSLVADRSHQGCWFASLWSWGTNADGGIFASSDDGRTWKPLLLHHAVRALAQAPSLPGELVAATLDGVYASSDDGAHWNLITPPGDRELQNIESVAIDPSHPQEIYVGTWHLPWKTINGGHDWWQMRQGVIDDSDVFSITADRFRPATLFLSACSGIYRSDDHGNQFKKIQGIPYTARRTPALVQDPNQPSTLYAGTTQGLWVTRDQGATWSLLTSPNLRVNTVLVLPHRLLVGTDFAGVFVSNDDGRTFQSSNPGFSNRQVSALVNTPAGRYVAVTGDGAWGGVFFQPSGTSAWRQLPPLPHQSDVYALVNAPSGLLAGTAQGVFRLAWRQPGDALGAKAGSAVIAGRPAGRALPGSETGSPSDQRERPGQEVASHANRWLPTGPRDHVFALAGLPTAPGRLWAATSSGLYQSTDGGARWAKLPSAPAPLFCLLVVPAPDAETGVGASWLFAAGDGYVIRSADGGQHFIAGRLSLDHHGIPAPIRQLAADPLPAGGDLLLAATSVGLYQSRDWGAHWSLTGHGLPAAPMSAVHFRDGEIFAFGMRVGDVFRSSDEAATWQPFPVPPELEMLARAAPSLALPFSLGLAEPTSRSHR